MMPLFQHAPPWVLAARSSVGTSSPLPLQWIPDSVAPATMSALRIGMWGDRVAAWQSFLYGRGFDTGIIDGYFGEHTRDATMAFQHKYKLEEDGVAGRQTLLKAAALGFELIEEPAADETSSNFPSRPNFQPLVANEQRAAVFGHFDYVAAPMATLPEAINILGSWEDDNIVPIPIPQ
jgi:peptidoglycan hydrolase-like protein with peptidoglycan-binding domain